MFLRNRLIRVGLLFLILASAWKYFLHPNSTFSGEFIDGATGLLFGISIGCILLGLMRNGRSSPSH